MTETTRAGAALRLTGVTMLLALCSLSGLLLYQSHTASHDRSSLLVHRAAHVVATQFVWLLEASAQTLRHIETSLDITHNAAGNGILSLSDAVRDLPSGLHYAVYDRGGRLTHSSLSSPHPISVADRPYFAQARDGAELTLAPMVTDRHTGEPSMILARRIDRTDGFGGVITIAIPVAKLETLAEALGLGPGSTISLVHTGGMLLARAPPAQPMDLSDTVLFDALAKSPDGNFTMVSPADGVRRIAGFWKLPGWPVVAVAGIDTSAAFADFRTTLRSAVVITLPVMFALGWMLHGLLVLMRKEDAQRIALRDANDRANFLLREVHHRVKNNLQTVSSLIRLESDIGDAAKDSLLGRLTAMVAVHEAMYRSDQFEEICIAPYVERLVADIARSHGGEVTRRLDIAPIRLSGDRAMLLGLLVNELVSNAWKHAFAARGGGLLHVAIAETPQGMIRVVVADDGPGFPANRNGSGMGTRLIEAFAAQLGGSVAVDSTGSTTVTVTFPRDFREGAAPPQSRPDQTASVTGARSRVAILSSNPARSSSRT